MKNPTVVDVHSFFEKLIDGYTGLGDSAEDLARQIPTLSPLLIETRCESLAAERQKLSSLDDQLIEILHLAGEELSTSSFIIRYRMAFSRASDACDEIKRQLVLRKSQFEGVEELH